MSDFVAVIEAFSGLPLELLTLLLALGVLVFAGYCVYVIHSLNKRGKQP